MKSIPLALVTFALSFVGLNSTAHAQTESDAKLVKIVMETSKGTIELELDAAKAPITVANFVGYVKKGHYDGLIFHRVIRDFMIQGGGFTPDIQEKEAGPTIENEAKNGLKNVRGAIAMARRGDPHSASSQFFLVHQDSSFLDYPGRDGWGYCVFGKVTKGLDIVDTIAAASVTVYRSVGGTWRPLNPDEMKSFAAFDDARKNRGPISPDVLKEVEQWQQQGLLENVPVEPILIKSAKVAE